MIKSKSLKSLGKLSVKIGPGQGKTRLVWKGRKNRLFVNLPPQDVLSLLAESVEALKVAKQESKFMKAAADITFDSGKSPDEMPGMMLRLNKRAAFVIEWEGQETLVSFRVSCFLRRVAKYYFKHTKVLGVGGRFDEIKPMLQVLKLKEYKK